MTPVEAESMARADAYVVIDALRATTTISTLFSRGLNQLRVVTGVDAALAAKQAEDVLLFGEIGGLPPVGFDYGNSPAEAAGLDVRGRNAILMTSNGTKALCAVAPYGPVVSGALVNLAEVVAWAAQAERVLLVCSGNHGARSFSLEDFAVAAEMVHALAERFPSADLGDAAKLATLIDSPKRSIANSEHADIVRALGLAEDVAFVASRDGAPSLPKVIDFGTGWALLEDRRER